MLERMRSCSLRSLQCGEIEAAAAMDAGIRYFF